MQLESALQGLSATKRRIYTDEPDKGRLLIASQMQETSIARSARECADKSSCGGCYTASLSFQECASRTKGDRKSCRFQSSAGSATTSFEFLGFITKDFMSFPLYIE